MKILKEFFPHNINELLFGGLIVNIVFNIILFHYPQISIFENIYISGFWTSIALFLLHLRKSKQ